MKKLSVFFGIAALSLILTASVFAQTPTGNARPTRVIKVRTSISPKISRSPQDKTRACQARENAIKIRSEKLTQLAKTMELKFDAIVTRVKDYYTSKLVPSGKTVAGYNDLLDEIGVKKDNVKDAIAKAQTNISKFNCTAGNPKNMLMQFNQDMRMVKSALKDYRTSTKNLIVAVRSSKGQLNRTNPSGKPT